MSIRHSLLALLDERDAYGYQLRARFEALTGSVWPLNIGQVYTTLGRLERDGLVSGTGTGEDGRAMYRLTAAGRAELDAWWLRPVSRTERPRDELAIKIALAVTTPGVDTTLILQGQRTDTMRSLQDLTKLKRHADPGDLPWLLVLESMIFAAEAEIRWLDHCESTLIRHARTTRPAATAVTEDSTQDKGARR